MKQRFVLLAVLLTITLMVPVVLLNSSVLQTNDNLDNSVINELLNEISDDWDSISNKKAAFVPEKDGISYEVIDNNGNILIRTESGMPVDLGRATTERYTIRDIKVDGEVVGKLLINNEFKTLMANTQKAYIKRFIIIVAIEAVIISLFLLWVYMNIVRPFDKLKAHGTFIPNLRPAHRRYESPL